MRSQQHPSLWAVDRGSQPDPADALDARTLREAFGCFPSGVIAVCGLTDGRPTGMAVSSFTSVSMDPPLVSVCVQLSSRTWPRLRSLPRLGLSVLGADQGSVCRALAGPEPDRFTDVGWETGADATVFLHGAVTWYSCTLRAEVPAGDHNIALLEIDRLWSRPASEPLVFHGSRFRRLQSHEPTATLATAQSSTSR